jgi:hypothetical protein
MHLFYFCVELYSGFGLAQHGSPVGPTVRHGLCNGQRAVPGLEDRPSVPARHDLFLILAVLGPGSNGPSPHRLGPGRPGMTHWPDILAYQVHTTPFSVFRFNSTYSISSHHSQFSYSHSSVFIFNITYLTTHILSFQIRHGSVFIFNNTYSQFSDST